MNLKTGTVTRTEIAANGEGETPTQVCKAQLVEDNDVQTVETQKIPGIQYGPTIGKHGFFGMFRAARKIFLSLWDGVAAQQLNQGELLLYSSDATVIKGKALFKKDGSIGIKNVAESVDFATAMTAYNVAVKGITTFGSPTAHVVTAASQTALDNALADVLKIFSGIP